MKAKIINDETKEVSVANGSNPPADYKEMEVEHCWNGNWYVKGYAPKESIDSKNEKIRLQRQIRYLQESDPLRLDYDEALARGEDNAEALKQEWLASKDKIRKELPYIVGA